MRGVRTLLLTCGTAAGVTACGGGGGGATPSPAATPTPTATPAATATAASATANPLALAAAAFNGHSTGTWNNDTFHTSGSVVTDVTIDPVAQSVSFHVVLGGNVFGAPAPAPQLFVGKIAPTSGGGFAITGTSPFLGPFTITVTPDGKLTVNCPSVPGGRVSTMTATGTVTDPKILKLSYTVTLSGGGSASGTATLTKS
jgi:hypothetical protein